MYNFKEGHEPDVSTNYFHQKILDISKNHTLNP